MRQPRFPAISFSSLPFAVSSTAVRGRHWFPPSTVRSRHLGFDEGGSSKYWDKFYKRHQNKFFKDRHYLEKDWGKYFSDDSPASPNGKVVLEGYKTNGSYHQRRTHDVLLFNLEEY